LTSVLRLEPLDPDGADREDPDGCLVNRVVGEPGRCLRWRRLAKNVTGRQTERNQQDPRTPTARHRITMPTARAGRQGAFGLCTALKVREALSGASSGRRHPGRAAFRTRPAIVQDGSDPDGGSLAVAVGAALVMAIGYAAKVNYAVKTRR
jgi:hypothetical protein